MSKPFFLSGTECRCSNFGPAGRFLSMHCALHITFWLGLENRVAPRCCIGLRRFTMRVYERARCSRPYGLVGGCLGNTRGVPMGHRETPSRRRRRVRRTQRYRQPRIGPDYWCPLRTKKSYWEKLLLLLVLLLWCLQTPNARFLRGGGRTGFQASVGRLRGRGFNYRCVRFRGGPGSAALAADWC